MKGLFTILYLILLLSNCSVDIVITSLVLLFIILVGISIEYITPKIISNILSILIILVLLNKILLLQ